MQRDSRARHAAYRYIVETQGQPLIYTDLTDKAKAKSIRGFRGWDHRAKISRRYLAIDVI
jgi:hypothetical protein